MITVKYQETDGLQIACTECGCKQKEMPITEIKLGNMVVGVCYPCQVTLIKLLVAHTL